MRKTFLYTLFGLAMTAVATAGDFYPAGEVLPQMIPTKSKRHAPAGGAAHHPHHVARGSTDGFIPVSPAVKAIPVIGHGKDGPSGKRRFLRKDEVVVPDTLQNLASKRAASCGDPNYGVCPNQQMCCPIGGLCCKSGDCCDKGYRCCTTGECCPDTHNCVTVNGINGCCPIGQTCSSTATQCADSGFVLCEGQNFCCRPGDTCTRDATGKASCKSGSTGLTTTTSAAQQPTTTTTTTPAAATTTTTKPAPAPTTTTTTTTPAPQPTTTSTTTEVKVQETTSATTSDQQIPTTASQPATTPVGLGGGPPTTMFNPTAVTTLPNASVSVSTPVASNVDIPVGNSSGAMAITAGLGYSVLMTAVSFALGHVLIMA